MPPNYLRRPGQANRHAMRRNASSLTCHRSAGVGREGGTSAPPAINSPRLRRSVAIPGPHSLASGVRSLPLTTLGPRPGTLPRLSGRVGNRIAAHYLDSADAAYGFQVHPPRRFDKLTHMVRQFRPSDRRGVVGGSPCPPLGCTHASHPAPSVSTICLVFAAIARSAGANLSNSPREIAFNGIRTRSRGGSSTTAQPPRM